MQSITDFVNIAQLMDTPPERPKLFQQLKNAMETTINYWESVCDLYQCGNNKLED